MIQPYEMSLGLPMEVADKVLSTTDKVWRILVASRDGDLAAVKRMVADCPELIYAQYNYTPPIHFAVREGHRDLVRYLLDHGAHDPTYRIYPFLDNLQALAQDRGHEDIVSQLQAYANDPSRQKYKGDNGTIHFNRNELQKEFEHTVNKLDIVKTEQILQSNPEFALDETYFWGEGILMKPAKVAHFKLVKLLMDYGAKVPDILKWTQFYYFERYDSAVFLMENGINPNVMSWHHVTILHDMAQKGDVQKAALLIGHGADIDPLEDEYQSTPLGMAARWGHLEMVDYLLKQGADPNRSGADWAKPLTWATRRGHNIIAELLKQHGAI